MGIDIESKLFLGARIDMNQVPWNKIISQIGYDDYDYDTIHPDELKFSSSFT